MERIYLGSEGITTRIFGFGEAVAAAGPAPAPAPAPAPQTPVHPITLSASTPAVITGAVAERTYLGAVVDGAEIDVSGAGLYVGESFQIVLTNPLAVNEVTIKESLTKTETISVPDDASHVILKFTVLNAGTHTALVDEVLVIT